METVETSGAGKDPVSQTPPKAPQAGGLLLRVSCPECYRVYAVDPSEIREANPRFQCLQCQSQFWFPFPEALAEGDLIGLPLSLLEPEAVAPVKEEVKTGAPVDVPCPKCKTLNPAKASDCARCGVVFAKYRELQEDPASIGMPFKFRQMWQKVLDGYTDEDMHREFVSLCHREGHLEYASRRYRALLNALGEDVLAQKYLHQILAMASAPTQVASPKSFSAPSPRIPIVGFFIAISGLLIATGFILPAARNLVGAGAALLFLTLAFRFSIR